MADGFRGGVGGGRVTGGPWPPVTRVSGLGSGYVLMVLGPDSGFGSHAQLGFQMRRYLFEYGLNFYEPFSHGG